MAYNTGNPSGSSDPRDLSDSSADIDTWATSTTADTHPDRLGTVRKTWHGMESEFDADQVTRASEYAADKVYRDTTYNDAQADRAQRFDLFLANSGYQFVGDYAAGIELTEYNQVVRDVSGNLWRVSASTSLPYTTTGAGLPEGGAFIAIGDADLAQNLISAPSTGQGALLVRGSVIYVDTIADLQALPTSELVDGQAVHVKEYYTGTGVGGGVLYWDADSTEADNGGTILEAIDTATGRWKRIESSIVNVLEFGADPTNAAVSTNAFNAAVLAAEGKTLHFPKGEYTSGVILPRPNTIVALSPGTTINAIANGTRVFQVQQENVHIWGYGAKTVMDKSQSSHNVYFNASHLQGARNCSVRGLELVGSGGEGDDCIYVGGSVQGVGGDPSLEAIPENIVIEDCRAYFPNRNGISIVAGENVTVNRCFIDCDGSTILRKAIDIEANTYMSDGSNPIKNCKITNNHCVRSKGIGNIFGDDVLIEDNYVEIDSAANSPGISGAAGGNQFKDSVYREGDRLGISAFDTVTGNITVRSSTDPSLHDLGIHVGMWCQGQVRANSGAAFPSELSSPYRYTIDWISADGTQMRLSRIYGYDEFNSYSDSGSGNLDLDPTVSDLWFNVFRPGQNSNVRIRNNHIKYVGTAESASGIEENLSYDWVIEGNRVEMGQSTGVAIKGIYGYGTRYLDNKTYGSIRGLSVGSVNKFYSRGNEAHDATLEAFVFGNSYWTSINDMAVNPAGGGFKWQNGKEGRLIAPHVFSDENSPLSGKAISFENSTEHGLIESAVVGGGGVSADNSYGISPSTKVVNSKKSDGRYYNELESTYDAPSIVDGSSVTQALPWPGTNPGDFIIATLENNTEGLSVSASAYNGGFRLTITNNTGALVDLGSTTLRAKRFTRY